MPDSAQTPAVALQKKLTQYYAENLQALPEGERKQVLENVAMVIALSERAEKPRRWWLDFLNATVVTSLVVGSALAYLGNKFADAEKSREVARTREELRMSQLATSVTDLEEALNVNYNRILKMQDAYNTNPDQKEKQRGLLAEAVAFKKDSASKHPDAAFARLMIYFDKAKVEEARKKYRVIMVKFNTDSDDEIATKISSKELKVPFLHDIHQGYDDGIALIDGLVTDLAPQPLESH